MWAVATLASLALLGVLVLGIPLAVTLRIDVHGRPKVRTRLVWLFGLVSKEIEKGKKPPAEKRRLVKDKPKSREGRGKGRAMFQILRTKGLLGQFKRLVKDILSHFKIRDLEVNLRVGLDNPADTGLLFAFIGPATFWLNSTFPHRIRVQPAFDEAVFEGYLYGALRLRPIQLVPPLLRFAFSLTTLRVLKTLVLAKWKRKK